MDYKNRTRQFDTLVMLSISWRNIDMKIVQCLEIKTSVFLPVKHLLESNNDSIALNQRL